MLTAGPGLMDLVFGGDFDYDRLGLVLISLGMGLYLSAATLNQAALARGPARQAAVCWLACATPSSCSSSCGGSTIACCRSRLDTSARRPA